MLLGVLPPDWLPKLLFVCFLACIVASQFVSERTATYTQPLTLLAYVQRLPVPFHCFKLE